MKQSLREQSPANVNAINTVHGSISKSGKNLLQGFVANSWNGGMVKPVFYKKYMAGEKIDNLDFSGIIRMITPKYPVPQKLKTVVTAYFVPDTTVFDSAEEYYSQKGGATKRKITSKPTFAGMIMPTVEVPTGSAATTKQIMVTDTVDWRDSWVSTYIPRFQTGMTGSGMTEMEMGNKINLVMPDFDACIVRGFIKIYNDFIRNKALEPEQSLDTSDKMSEQEWKSYLPYTYDNKYNDIVTAKNVTAGLKKRLMPRGRRQDSYYTDYRTEVNGLNETAPNYNNMFDYNEWQKLIAESRTEAMNEQKNDWEIVAELRGTSPIVENRVIEIGRTEIPMNYQQVAQDTYNVNQEVEESFQALGAVGAYVETQFNVNLGSYVQFKQDGYIHFIVQTTADTVFETGFDRVSMNVRPDQEYRPDYKDIKEDVLYDIEMAGTGIATEEDLAKIRGFKRKFSEYFKAPNCIGGDMSNNVYYGTDIGLMDDGKYGLIAKPTEIVNTKKEFTFFETDDNTANVLLYPDNAPATIQKATFRDYTDLQINENQVYEQPVEFIEDDPFSPADDKFIRVRGENQIYMIGMVNIPTNLPIDQSIKNNFIPWGEK